MKKLLYCFIALLLLPNFSFAQLTVSITMPGQCFVTSSTATAVVTGTPPGAASYSWTVSSGISICSSGNTVSVVNATMALITFGCCGNKTITCSAYAANNSLITSTATPVSIACNTNYSATASSSLVCAGGGTTTLNASGSGTYSWSTGATGSQATVAVLSATVYTVTGTFSTGCTNTKTVAVNTFSPAFQVTPPSATICSGNTLALSASGAASYTWTSPGGPPMPFSSIMVSPLVNTTYTVAATSQSNGVNCISTKTVPVFVTSGLTISAISTPTSVCPGQQATITASGASTYTWNTLQQGSAVTVTVPLSGPASYTVIGSSGNCTSNTLTVNISVLPHPTVVITPGNSTLCAGESVTLTANGAQSYTWSNSLIAPSITVTAVNGSNYSATGTGTNGCDNTANYTLAVHPLPTITAVASRTLICKLETITLSPGGGASYTWSPVAGSGTLSISPLNTTTYTLVGKDNNGCVNSATVLVKVVICIDGLNDPEMASARIYPNPAANDIFIELIEPATITIRNISGQILYCSRHFEKVNHVDISNLEPGCYFITLENSVMKKDVKFVRQ